MDGLTALGVWAAVGALWALVVLKTLELYATREPEAAPLAPAALRPSGNGAPPPLEPAWSPEGWGPPDSEVITTEGDDYLMRMHRPPREE